MQSNHEDADIENKLMDRGGGEGERKGESSMDACTVISGNRWPVGNLLYHSGNSNWGSVITERGGNGGKWEGDSRGRGHMYKGNEHTQYL